jgi:hypothetical protein
MEKSRRLLMQAVTVAALGTVSLFSPTRAASAAAVTDCVGITEVCLGAIIDDQCTNEQWRDGICQSAGCLYALSGCYIDFNCIEDPGDSSYAIDCEGW